MDGAERELAFKLIFNMVAIRQQSKKRHTLNISDIPYPILNG